MPTQPPPIESLNERTLYADGHLLTATALARDGDALERSTQRHQSVVHVGGIIAGLYVRAEYVRKSRTLEVIVSPGAAVTCRGTFIYSGEIKDTARPHSSNRIGVWLVATRTVGRRSDSDFDRSSESGELHLEEVTAGSIPSQTAQQGVFLAELEIDVTANIVREDSRRRQYVSAVGARVVGPSGRSRILLGPEQPDDTRLFAIGIERKPLPVGTPLGTQTYVDAISLESTGKIRLRTRTAIDSQRRRTPLKRVVSSTRPSSLYLRPPAGSKAQALILRGSKAVDKEPDPCRIHLVQSEEKKARSEQLRISIPNPGKENNPQRYRCSFGTAGHCNHPPQTEGAKSWNAQTGWLRGILSVLADGSVDIHENLYVIPKFGSDIPGLILQLKPKNSAESAPADLVVPSPPRADVIVLEQFEWARQGDKLTVSGSVRNLKKQIVSSLRLTLSVICEGESGSSVHVTLQCKSGLAGESAKPLAELLVSSEVDVSKFKGKAIVVYSVLVGLMEPTSLVEAFGPLMRVEKNP